MARTSWIKEYDGGGEVEFIVEYEYHYWPSSFSDPGEDEIEIISVYCVEDDEETNIYNELTENEQESIAQKCYDEANT